MDSTVTYFGKDLIDVIDARITEHEASVTAVGTVVTRTGNTTAMITFDGSALAVPVKCFGDVNVDEGDRVGLARLGVDWTIIGTFTRRRQITMPDGATTGEQRTVYGADTPPELASFGVSVAVLFYVTDVTSGLEVGYFFIGQSNHVDAPAPGFRALGFGNVTYPTAGRPDTATAADVKCNFQMGMWAQTKATVFKDHDVEFWKPSGAPAPVSVSMFDEIDGTRHRMTPMSEGGINGTAAADSLTSTSNVALNEFGWNFRKNYDDTAVLLTLSIAGSSSVVNTSFTAGIDIGGTKTDITKHWFNTITEHHTAPFGYSHISGIPAGAYVPFAYWRRSAGTGTITRNSDDWISAHTVEVAM
jgi:hypothetical protein